MIGDFGSSEWIFGKNIIRMQKPSESCKEMKIFS